MDASLIPQLLAGAVLLPLASFTTIVLAGPRLGKNGQAAGTLATSAILGSAVLSFISLCLWLGDYRPEGSLGEHHDETQAVVVFDTDPDGGSGHSRRSLRERNASIAERSATDSSASLGLAGY